MSEVPIRDASTVILVRDASTRPRVLMGQRGKDAAFMPERFVFPGGAVEPCDAEVDLVRPLPLGCAAALADSADPGTARSLAATAIREVWEETGLALGTPAPWPAPPPAWARFAARGLRPCAASLRFVFRAVTPPGRPRRFDARFFLADAACVAGNLDDFSDAESELSHLQWIPFDEVRAFPLPFITEVVLAEVAAALPALDPPATVPFFKHDDEENLVLRLGGRGPMQGA